MADNAPNGLQPTASEALFFFSIVKNMKALSDIDWAAVAEDRGFKNAEVAKVRFGQVKRKLGVHSEASKNSPKKGGATPSKVTKTPTGRSGTKGKKGGRGVKKEEEQDDDTMDENPTKREPKEESKSGVKREKKSLQENIDAMIDGGSGDGAEPF